VIEIFAPGFVYSVLKDAYFKFAPKRRKLTNSEIVELRKKWKAEIDPHILETHRKKLRQDVIIRDMRRIDSYPDIKEDEKGISPWFKVGLVATYHRGILIALRWHSLTRRTDGKRYRRTNYKTGEKGDLNAILIGMVPFENIDNIDWDGTNITAFRTFIAIFPTTMNLTSASPISLKRSHRTASRSTPKSNRIKAYEN
jgi:hypothetical protein